MKKSLIKKELFLLLFLNFLLLTNAFAYSVYDLFYGTEIRHHDARVSALGGSGVAAGFTLMDSNLNPANLYFLEQKLGANFNYSLIKDSESRALPMWNFFDSFVGHSTYARNENFYNEFSLGAFYSLPLNDSKLTFALVMRPVVNFAADYREEVRNDNDSNNDNYPPIIAMNFIESEGLLYSYNLLLNWGIPFGETNISVGAEISYYNGDYRQEERIIWTDTARDLSSVILNDYYDINSDAWDGFGVKFGLASQVTPRIRLGATFSPKITLGEVFIATPASDSQDIGNEFVRSDSEVREPGPHKKDYIIPSKFRFGFLFKPRNPFKTHFHADIEMINFSEMNNAFEDGYAFYVGMEHYIGRAIPFRLGFSHQTARQDKAISLPTISIGTGFGILDNLHLDLSAEYGKREYVDLDLFPDSFYNKDGLWNYIRPADRDWENPDKVTESFLKFFTSLTYYW
ncbi:MAG: hypothetical protein FWG98_01825 [Candidatus Cloacimonetes bacterium]|nr:hypothetical protein [Candidatus Cloacimonadota bacterium]